MINSHAAYLKVMHRITYLFDRGANLSAQEAEELDDLCEDVKDYEDRRYPLFD